MYDSKRIIAHPADGVALKERAAGRAKTTFLPWRKSRRWRSSETNLEEENGRPTPFDDDTEEEGEVFCGTPRKKAHFRALHARRR